MDQLHGSPGSHSPPEVEGFPSPRSSPSPPGVQGSYSPRSSPSPCSSPSPPGVQGSPSPCSSPSPCNLPSPCSSPSPGSPLFGFLGVEASPIVCSLSLRELADPHNHQGTAQRIQPSCNSRPILTPLVLIRSQRTDPGVIMPPDPPTRTNRLKIRSSKRKRKKHGHDPAEGAATSLSKENERPYELFGGNPWNPTQSALHGGVVTEGESIEELQRVSVEEQLQRVSVEELSRVSIEELQRVSIEELSRVSVEELSRVPLYLRTGDDTLLKGMGEVVGSDPSISPPPPPHVPRRPVSPRLPRGIGTHGVSAFAPPFVPRRSSPTSASGPPPSGSPPSGSPPSDSLPSGSPPSGSPPSGSPPVAASSSTHNPRMADVHGRCCAENIYPSPLPTFRAYVYQQQPPPSFPMYLHQLRSAGQFGQPPQPMYYYPSMLAQPSAPPPPPPPMVAPPQQRRIHTFPKFAHQRPPPPLLDLRSIWQFH